MTNQLNHMKSHEPPGDDVPWMGPLKVGSLGRGSPLRVSLERALGWLPLERALGGQVGLNLGVKSVSFREQFGVTLGSRWDACGVTFGVILG